MHVCRLCGFPLHYTVKMPSKEPTGKLSAVKSTMQIEGQRKKK